MFKKAIILIFSLSLLGCTNFNLLGECGYDYQEKLIDPNNNYKAVHFIENCGATTDFYTLVQIGNIQNKKNETNLLIKGYYDSEIKLSWPEDKKLRIDLNGELKYIINFQPQFEDITVELYKNDKLISDEELKEAQTLRKEENSKFDNE